jgi:single-strand DNA-binding protein
MNHVVLIGRLTRDPEYRVTPNNIPVSNFTIAVDREFVKKGQGQQEVDFVPIVVWSKLAEVCADHLKKGRLVACEGRLQIRSYDTKDGQKKKVAEVYANSVQFLDRVKEDGQAPASGNVPEDMGEINLDDLPF